MHHRALPFRALLNSYALPIYHFVHAFHSMTARPAAEVGPRDG